MDKILSVLLKSVFVNILLVSTKLIVGFIGNSKAMIANGIHSLSDLITDVISIFGHVISRKPANMKYPLGYGKMEYLTSIIVGVVILFLGLESIINALDFKPVVGSDLILFVSCISMIVKYILSLYILNKGNEYKNSILIVSGIESRADALTSSLVLISVILSKLTPYSSIYAYSDNVTTFIIGVYIIYTAIKILKENILNILTTTLDNPIILEDIKGRIMEHKEIDSIIDLVLIKYGSYYVATLELDLRKNISLKKINELKGKLRHELINNDTKISYLTISVNYSKGSEKGAGITRGRNRKRAVKEKIDQ